MISYLTWHMDDMDHGYADYVRVLVSPNLYILHIHTYIHNRIWICRYAANTGGR